MAEIPLTRSITIRPRPLAGTGGAARCARYSSLFSRWCSSAWCFVGIEREAAKIDFQLLVTALRATPAASLAAALAATALSYLALIGYDVSALRYARAHAPLRTILLASFSGFAIGNAVGLGAFSGGTVRYRLYTAAGLSPGQIARVVLFLSIAFGIGLGTIAALSMILQASEVSRLLGVSPQPLRAVAAIILTLAGGFLIFCAVRRTPWRRGAIDIDAPGATLMLIQVLLTAIDVLAAAATLWVLLPPMGISFFAFAPIYSIALALGVLSHVPGGLGVFEVAILYAVGGSAPVNAVAAALVTYRGIYFLLPLLLSTLLLANFELRRSLRTATGQRIGRAASHLAPLFLAATTFTVGAILVVSGAMPAFVDRLQILHIAIPLWAVEVSHFLTSVAGLFLLFAAHGLYRRLDGAWWLALSMTLLGIPFSLIKGLAVVAPSVLVILLIGLVTARGQFSRRTSLLSQPMSSGWLIATGCVIAAMVWILFFAFRNVEYARELWWQFEFDAAGPRALRAVLGVALLGLVLGVSQLLRPAGARPGPPNAEEIDRARRIAARQPRPDALLALMGDKSFLFSDSGLGFLMFATRGRTWAALGDPVGPRAEWPDLMWRFIELADSHGGRAAFYQIPASSLPLYLDAGLKILKLGEEARVSLASFTLEGSARADLRYALKRGERDQLQFEMIPPERVASIMNEIAEVSNAWLSKHAPGGEKRFSVAAFQREYVLAQPVALLRQNGEAVAFATVMTTDLRDEVTLGLMRTQARPDIALRDGVSLCPSHPAFSRTRLPHIQPRHIAALWLFCASAGTEMASFGSCDRVARTPLLQFSRPAHFQGKIRPGLGAALPRRLGMVWPLSCSHRYCCADRRGHAGCHPSPWREQSAHSQRRRGHPGDRQHRYTHALPTGMGT